MIINDVVVRKATDIRKENDIANFPKKYFTPFHNVSAISFEVLNMDSFRGKYWLLKNFLALNYPNEKKLSFVIQLSEQPNQKSIKFKGIQRILKFSGVNIDSFYNRKELFYESNSKLNIVGYAEVDVEHIEFMIKLINDVDYLYFSLGGNDIFFDNYEKWINYKLNNNKLVLFFLEDLWGGENEMVVIDKNINVLKLRIT